MRRCSIWILGLGVGGVEGVRNGGRGKREEGEVR